MQFRQTLYEGHATKLNFYFTVLCSTRPPTDGDSQNIRHE